MARPFIVLDRPLHVRACGMGAQGSSGKLRVRRVGDFAGGHINRRGAGLLLAQGPCPRRGRWRLWKAQNRPLHLLKQMVARRTRRLMSATISMLGNGASKVDTLVGLSILLARSRDSLS